MGEALNYQFTGSNKRIDEKFNESKRESERIREKRERESLLHGNDDLPIDQRKRGGDDRKPEDNVKEERKTDFKTHEGRGRPAKGKTKEETDRETQRFKQILHDNFGVSRDDSDGLTYTETKKMIEQLKKETEKQEIHEEKVRRGRKKKT